MRIFITGGAGFIGSHLCDYFLAHDHDVIAMDNFITGSPDNIAHLANEPRLEFIEQDVTKFIHVPGDIDAVLILPSPRVRNRTWIFRFKR